MMTVLRAAMLALLFWVVAEPVLSAETVGPPVKPLRMTPVSGSFEGGQLVFIQVEEPSAAAGKSSISCRFGPEPVEQGQFDKKSGHYICQMPPHPRPESVGVSVLANGKEFQMEQRYVYTTHGKYDSPVTKILVPNLLKQVKRVRDKIPEKVKLCAVLKNGNPAGWLAKAMADATGIDYFCVPRVQDGIAMRRAGVTQPIIVMYLTDASYVPALLHYELQPAAYSLSWVKEATRIMEKTGGRLNVHLWIDTGISREGVVPSDALPLARAIHKSPSLNLQGIGTHFCCLDEGDLAELKKNNLKNKTTLQKHRFDKAVKAIHSEGIGLDAILHASSSDGLRHGLTPVYYGMLRVGTMLFENPEPESRNYSWKTKILQVKTLPKGWCLNYGCKETFDEDIRVGLVAHIPDDSVTYYVRGEEVEKFLDHEVVIILDLSEHPDVQEGEEVTMVFGEDDDAPLDTSYSAPVTLLDKAGPN